MKSINIIFLIMTISFTQAKGQQAITNVSAEQVGSHHIVHFSVSSESNMYQYRIEATNDTASFEVAGIVKPKGNSVFGRDYQFAIYDQNYTYYRIGAVTMGNQVKYSKIMRMVTPETKPGLKPTMPVEAPVQTIARGNW